MHEQPEEVVWEPTGLADNIIVALSAVNQFFILITVLHLSWTFKWPPYVVRNVTLVCTTGLAGACWAIVIVSSYGTYKRTEGTLWTHCDIEVFVGWMSVGLLSNAGFVRIYRHYKLLYKHDRKMWQTEWQLALLSAPFLLPSIIYFLRPDLIKFDPSIQECVSEFDIVTPLVGLWCIGLVFVGLYLVYRMRHVRKQFNEYFLIRRVAVFIVLAPILFVFVDAVTGPEYGALRRRMEVVLSLFITGIFFWTPIYEPVKAFIMKDEDYLDLFTHGFYDLPTPAQLRESIADKLTIEELREEFRRYARTRVAPELVRFYTDVLERETVEDYFERQAVTMQIIERFVRPGSVEEVSITAECRERVLNSDVTRFDIFEEARLEVLKIMEDSLQRDLEAAPGYERFRVEVEGQAKERLLRIGSGMLPARTPQRALPHFRAEPQALRPSSRTSRRRVEPQPLSPMRTSETAFRPQVQLTPVHMSSPDPDTGGSLCYSSDGHVMYSCSSSEGHGRTYSHSTCKTSTPDRPTHM